MKFLIAIFFLGLLIVPQEFTTLNLLKKIDIDSDFMRVDNFGNIYVVKERKYSSTQRMVIFFLKTATNF